MKSELSNQIRERLGSFGLSTTGKENIDRGERILSVLAGGWLLYKSLKKIGRHPFLALHGAAAGGLMVYRGATGICPVYQQLGKDTTDPEAIRIPRNLKRHGN